jgi:putative transposase
MRLTDAQLLALLRSVHTQYKAAYGSPRMYRELRERGYRVSKTRVERLMREHDLRARHKRRFKATTNSKHALPVADNVLARDFAPAAPNRVWTADLTYVWTDEGWLNLAVVLDLFNREIVGWSIKPRMSAGMICSMSRKGNCWDNAPTESFFNSLKNERVHGTRYATREAAIADLFDYIEVFYNRSRKHSSLGYVSPARFLAGWISSQHEQAVAA